MDESGGDYSAEFDAALEDVLPDDIDSEEISSLPAGQDDGYSQGGWFASEYSFSNQYSKTEASEIAMGEVDRIIDTLSLPASVRGMSRSLFEQYQESADKTLIIELYASAAAYCACKFTGEGITPDEIADASVDLLTRKRLLRRAKDMASQLGLDAEVFVDSSQYIQRFCAELDLNDGVETRAKTIVEYADEAGLTSGKSPTGFAASAIYLAARERRHTITQSDICRVSDTTEVTIRNRYQEQLEVLNDAEPAPESPHACIDWAARRLELPDAVRGRAHQVLSVVEEHGGTVTMADGTQEAVEAQPVRWALAAVHVGCEITGAELNHRATNVLSGADAGWLTPPVRRLRRQVKQYGKDPRFERDWDDLPPN